MKLRVRCPVCGKPMTSCVGGKSETEWYGHYRCTHCYEQGRSVVKYEVGPFEDPVQALFHTQALASRKEGWRKMLRKDKKKKEINFTDECLGNMYDIARSLAKKGAGSDEGLYLVNMTFVLRRIYDRLSMASSMLAALLGAVIAYIVF